MARGFMYLVAVMDWHSRKILSWRLSNTLDSDFCIQALQERFERYGSPEIFNTDQGAQFTSNGFTRYSKTTESPSAWTAAADARTTSSLNGYGGPSNTTTFTCMRSARGSELRQGLAEWVRFYNQERGHSSLDDRTPDEVYCGLPHPFAEAA